MPNEGTLIAWLVSIVIAGSGGLYVGYKIDESRAVRAESALSQIKATSDEAEKRYDKDKELLTAEIATIKQGGIDALAASAKNFAAYQTQAAQNLADKNAELVKVKTLLSAQQSSLIQLQSDLALAKTDKEKSDLQAQISIEQKAILESQNRQAGLQCLTVPVPKEYLDNVNEVGK